MIAFSIKKMLLTTEGKVALDVSYEVPKGQLTTIYGASGAGKTTILRILAGLLNPDDGRISVACEVWLDTANKINLQPQRRNIGIVFQDYALFPNMSVKKNLEYALDRGQDRKAVDELIEVMELQKLCDRYPDMLSGGQKQRVALARALVRKPALLLLDEPLSALDNEMRSKLQDHILQVHRHYSLTTILVSHDISEIFRMSDKILVLENGRITKQGSKSEVFGHQQVSSKIQLMGDVLDIEKEDIIYVVSVLVNNNIIKVVAVEEDILTLKPGDKVLVLTKAFSPIIRKIGL